MQATLLEKDVRRRPTLPPRHQGSTIGAAGLSFRVRNETGRFPSAMATETTTSFTNYQLPVVVTGVVVRLL